MDKILYERYKRELLEEAEKIENAKWPAYTLWENDRLLNFKLSADRAGITKEQAWLIYFLKHIDAITSYMKDKEIHQAEPILSRFADAINYLKLWYALINENDENE